jgi:hypothetical protein
VSGIFFTNGHLRLISAIPSMPLKPLSLLSSKTTVTLLDGQASASSSDPASKISRSGIATLMTCRSPARNMAWSSISRAHETFMAAIKPPELRFSYSAFAGYADATMTDRLFINRGNSLQVLWVVESDCTVSPLHQRQLCI